MIKQVIVLAFFSIFIAISANFIHINNNYNVDYPLMPIESTGTAG